MAGFLGEQTTPQYFFSTQTVEQDLQVPLLLQSLIYGIILDQIQIFLSVTHCTEKLWHRISIPRATLSQLPSS